jgi:hypothetical protein
MNDRVTHLLSSLGVLASFSIAKKLNKNEVDKLANKIKKNNKKENPKEFQKLVAKALIDDTQKYVQKQTPPGLIIPKIHPKKELLDKLYLELTSISQALTNTFKKQKIDKHQMCFIINALIHMNGLIESDFEEFQKKFQKYKDNDFDNDEDDE